MNTKAKLLSLCLAAVLLCGCIVGFMMLGAAAEETVVTWTVDGVGEEDTNEAADGRKFASLEAAMVEAATLTWGTEDTLTIVIDDSADAASYNITVDDNNVAWGAPTIWRGNRNLENGEVVYGNKLPITITANTAKKLGVAAALTAQFTNDIHFLNVSPEHNVSTCNYYAGSGNVHIDRDYRGGGVRARFHGCPLNEAAFEGWTAEDIAEIRNANDEKLVPVGFEFSGFKVAGSCYGVSGSAYIVGETVAVTAENRDSIHYAPATSAVDGVAVLPSQTKISFVVNNGAAVGSYVAASSDLSVGHIYSKNDTSELGATSGSYGNATLQFNGPSKANFSKKVTMEYGPNHGQRCVPDSLGAKVTPLTTQYGATAALTGDLEIIIEGYGWVEETTYNEAVLTTSFQTTSSSVTGNVNVIIKGGTINEYYGGRCSSATVGKATTTVPEDSTANITKFYGGSKTNSSTLNHTVVENYIYDGTFGSFFGGWNNSVSGSTGTVTNNIYGGDFSGFKGSSNGTVVSVTNNIYAGTFSGNFYGAGNLAVAETVTNNIHGGAFGGHFYGGQSHDSASCPAVINNNIYAGRFKNNYDGGNVEEQAVSTTITNVFQPNDPEVALRLDKGTISAGNATNPATIDAVGGLGGIYTIGDANSKLMTFATVDNTAGPLKVKMVGNWYQNNVYIQAPNTAEFDVDTYSHTTYGRGHTYVDGDYVYVAANPLQPTYTNLVLGEKISIKLYFDAAETELMFASEASKNSYTNLSCKVDGVAATLSTSTYYTGAVETVAEKDYYVVEVTGISPADLTKDIVLGGRVVGGTTTLNQILENTKAVASEELVALCEAIQNLGGAGYEVAVGEVDLSGAYAETSEVIKGFGIVMNDAVGYTLYAADAATAAAATYTVKVNGVVVEGAKFNEEGLMDIFVKVERADDVMKIEVLEGENSIFTMEASIAQVAATYVDNADATNILAYIQAANAYKASL